MNGKQAKRLRRAAMGLAVAIDQSGRKMSKDGYEVQEHKQYSASSFSSSVMSDTKSRDTPDAPPEIKYTLHVRADSVKGIYKKMKKGVISGKVGNLQSAEPREAPAL